jgi:hypothetical protein
MGIGVAVARGLVADGIGIGVALGVAEGIGIIVGAGVDPGVGTGIGIGVVAGGGAAWGPVSPGIGIGVGAGAAAGCCGAAGIGIVGAWTAAGPCGGTAPGIAGIAGADPAVGALAAVSAEVGPIGIVLPGIRCCPSGMVTATAGFWAGMKPGRCSCRYGPARAWVAATAIVARATMHGSKRCMSSPSLSRIQPPDGGTL